jgi:rhomboid protease GluP
VSDNAPTQIEDPQRPRRPSLNERIRQTPGTFSLIGVTLFFFLSQMVSAQLIGYDWVLEISVKSKPDILAGQFWRIISPMFVHVGITHIFVNMYSLYVIGPPVERFFGTVRFLVIYFLSGIGGVALSLAFSPSPSAGASGAIFGLLGALGAFLFIHRGLFGRMGQQQLRQIVVVAVLNLVIGLAPGIDQWGHFGGFVTGIALAASIGPRYERSQDTLGQTAMVDTRTWQSVRPDAILAGGIVIIITFIAIFLI